MTRACIIEGCEKDRDTDGYCGMHYYRVRVHGDPDYVNPNRVPGGEKLKWLIEAIKLRTDECIIWPFKTAKGYGFLSHEGKRWLAHRLALVLHTGHNHQHLHACHKPVVCHNPSCVNPRHLIWGSAKDNVRHQVMDGTMVRGERHGHSKLTRQEVIEVRRLAGSGVLHEHIANRFGIAKSTVSGIVTRRIWQHVHHNTQPTEHP